MIYVLDTCSLCILKDYYPDHFPSFWQELERLVERGGLVSVREVLNELRRRSGARHLLAWAQAHEAIFPQPTGAETGFVASIFAVPHFQALIGTKQRLEGTPVADPFVIASACVRGGCVVTQEEKKPNSAKIPNVCDHFGIACTNLEGFMKDQGWRF